MNLYMTLKDSTREAEEFVELFQGGLEKLIGTNNLPPGMAIAILANLNFHGRNMPASVFRRLDYDQGWETPEDPIILAEALKRIKGREVVIDRTMRISIGEFRLQYNFVRGFRPKRGAKRLDIPLDLPFNPNKFNYGFKAVNPEVFHSVKYDNSLTVDFIFNRYPFAPYHFLWVPNRKKEGHNQYLDTNKDGYLIEAVWNFVREQGLGKGIRLGYNSNGAHASVNHLHFQGFLLTQDWEPPFETIIRGYKASKVKTGNLSGTIDCYLKGARWISDSDGIDGLKEFIGEMNQRYASGEKVAFNLYMSPEGIACFPRKHQGYEKYFELLQRSPFTTGYAFFEMLGEIISPTSDISILDKNRTERQIRDLYNALSLEQANH